MQGNGWTYGMVAVRVETTKVEGTISDSCPGVDHSTAEDNRISQTYSRLESRGTRLWVLEAVHFHTVARHRFLSLPSSLLVDHVDALAVISSLVVQVKVKAMEVVAGDKNKH